MKDNVTFSVGNLALIDKVDAQFDYFNRVFEDVGKRAKNIVSSAKLFIYNRLGDFLATNHLCSYPEQLFNMLDFKKKPSERSLYRMIERIGKIRLA